MSTGRAIITTDVPGCRETVIDGLNGFLINVKDKGALVEAIEKFIQNEELALSMGLESRKLVEEKFDVNKVNAEIIDQLASTYTKAGGNITISTYPNSVHGFAHSVGDDTDLFVEDLVSWLHQITEE